MKRRDSPWGRQVKWFKHYSGALGSESLADLMRDGGLEGYARYWILLEHLAGLFDGESTSFRIPKETIRGLFRIRSWTELDSFADRLTTVRGLNVKRNENVFEIDAPILLELLDRDFKKSRKVRELDAPKIKTKNKIKIKDKDLDREGGEPHPLIELWNSRCLKLPQIRKVSPARLKKIETLWKSHTPEELGEAIDRIAASDFCNGLNDRAWVASFNFFLQPDTPTKALEGNYDNRTSPDQVFGNAANAKWAGL